MKMTAIEILDSLKNFRVDEAEIAERRLHDAQTILNALGAEYDLYVEDRNGGPAIVIKVDPKISYDAHEIVIGIYSRSLIVEPAK